MRLIRTRALCGGRTSVPVENICNVLDARSKYRPPTVSELASDIPRSGNSVPLARATFLAG
jgi:hypothetical protein